MNFNKKYFRSFIFTNNGKYNKSWSMFLEKINVYVKKIEE